MALCCVASCFPGARGGVVMAPQVVGGAARLAACGSQRTALARMMSSGGQEQEHQEQPGVVEPGASLEPGAALSLWRPTAEDVRIVEERHLGNPINMLAVGMRCKHGCPQAFAFDSMSRAGAVYRGPGSAPRVKERALPIEAGLFRLTCPMLVNAIDEWEREGAVRQLNAQVAADGTGALPAALKEAHRKHAAARMTLFGARLEARLDEAPPDSFARSPEGAAVLDHIVGSGIAGQTQDKEDVKCLHAQTADYLCRNGDNAIGALILDGLEARGVDVRGDAECHNQCNLATPLEQARHGWWYEPSKNKWKLRKTARRRGLKREGAAPSVVQRGEIQSIGERGRQAKWSVTAAAPASASAEAAGSSA